MFIQLTADAAKDLPIEGKDLSFGTLIRAQAFGDLQALQSRGYRVVQIQLGKNVAAGLAAVQSAVAAAVGAKASTPKKVTAAKKSAPEKKAAAKKTAAKRPAAKKKPR